MTSSKFCRYRVMFSMDSFVTHCKLFLLSLCMQLVSPIIISTHCTFPPSSPSFFLLYSQSHSSFLSFPPLLSSMVHPQFTKHNAEHAPTETNVLQLQLRLQKHLACARIQHMAVNETFTYLMISSYISTYFLYLTSLKCSFRTKNNLPLPCILLSPPTHRRKGTRVLWQ